MTASRSDVELPVLEVQRLSALVGNVISAAGR